MYWCIHTAGYSIQATGSRKLVYRVLGKQAYNELSNLQYIEHVMPSSAASKFHHTKESLSKRRTQSIMKALAVGGGGSSTSENEANKQLKNTSFSKICFISKFRDYRSRDGVGKSLRQVHSTYRENQRKTFTAWAFNNFGNSILQAPTQFLVQLAAGAALGPK